MRGALTYLGDAERRIRELRAGNTLWAVMEQLHPHDTHIRYTRKRRPPGRSVPLLIFPAWTWMLLLGVALAVVGSLVSLTLVGALLGAALGLAGRFWLTLKLADELRSPSDEDLAEIHRALGEASVFMHEAGVAWVGEDPSVSEDPWQMLGAVRATLDALHAAESPPGH